MKIGYFGTPKHALDLLKELVGSKHEVVFLVTNPDKPKGRSREPVPSEIKEFAISHNIPVFQPASLKDPVLQAELNSIESDLHLVYAYGSIIPEEIYKTPKLGSINIHGSLLPKYRGASPVQTSLLNGDSIGGLTIQFLAREVDSGNIILKKEFPLDINDTTGQVLDKITQEGKLALFSLLDNSSQGFTSEVQNHSLASFCKKIKPEDRILDWNKSAFENHNKIRALNPNPYAYTHFKEKRILILESYIPTDDTYLSNGSEKPGMLLLPNKKSLFVFCGDKKMIGITKVQPEGKKPMSIIDFINGNKPLESEKFN
ncbi:MAG: methionyl-tRNA formyltransferase [Leptospiraceae bacterium]|nr:methionyl-tRNA formyltransferase [Leptospiraceae bacterium]